MRHRSSAASRRRLRVVALFTLVALGGPALAGCSDSDAGEPATPATPAGSAAPDAPGPSHPSKTRAAQPTRGDVQYVALGDSYAAAPGVPETDPAGGCFRSDHDYAHVLAAAADLSLTDVTCSGATSQDVIDDQVPALSRDTDVVTLGIGGNDFDLFSTILRSCLAVGGADVAGSPCTDALRDQLTDVGPAIEDNVGGVLDAVTAAAPAAEVYVVGYPALLPEKGTCPDLVPFAPGDYPLLTTITRRISAALEAAAEARDLTYVDVYTPSLGHDICSDEPWINGKDFAPDGTIPFHPLAVEQEAVAALIGQLL